MLDATSTCAACASPLLRRPKPVLGLIAGGVTLFMGDAYVVQGLMTLVHAFNRLFSQTHYLTDVMASLGIGTAWTLGSLMVVDFLLCRREKEKVQNDVR